MVIYSVYEGLRELGVVENQSEFCEKWLGRERSYLSVLEAKRRRPSCTVWAICAVRLLRNAEAVDSGTFTSDKATVRTYRVLASRCLDEVLTEGLRGKEASNDHQHH